jgi:hypothetical protein
VAEAGLHGLALVGRQVLVIEPGPASLAEQVARGRAPLQGALQDGVDLVLGPGALPDELGVSGHQTPEQPGPLVAQPHRKEEPRREQLGQGPSIEPIGLRLGRGDRSHGHGVGHHHPAGVALQDPGDGQSPSRGLQDHLILRPQALPEHLQVLRRRADPGTGPARMVLHDSHLAEVLVGVKSDEPHLPPPFLFLVEARRANDNYGCVLVAQPDQSQGRPITTAGSRPIVSRRPARPGSPEAPRPGGRTLREGPSLVQAASLQIFMQVQRPEAASRARSGSAG